MKIPYGKQHITEEDIKAVTDVLHSEYLTQGPKIKEFEDAFARYVGCRYAVAVANQQNAAYKLQKATPVMKVLDYPEEPYDVHKRSPVLYGIIGFFLGLILSTGYFTSRLFVRYGVEEFNRAVYGRQFHPAKRKSEIAA